MPGFAAITANERDAAGGPTARQLLIGTSALATMLSCSTKTIYRLADRGAIPSPVRIGNMLRWHRPQIEQWIADGCPAPPT